MSDNTLRQVRHADLYYLKESISDFITWYVRNCEVITELSQYFGDDEAETLRDILNAGINTVRDRMEVLKEGDMKRGDEL